MSLVVASCGGGSNSSEKIAQLEDSIARMQTRLDNQGINNSDNHETNNDNFNAFNGNESATETTTNDIVGVYKVIDKLGRVWIFTLNSDESATVSVEGSDAVGYGSWDDGHYDNGIWFDFEEEPRIIFPNMKEGFSGHGDMNSGYLYRSVNAAKSKDPHQRLEMKKIK